MPAARQARTGRSVHRRRILVGGAAPAPPPAQSLFTDQVPVNLDRNDLGPAGGATGTAILIGVDGHVTKIRFYGTDTISGSYTVELWPATPGARLASKDLAVAPVPGWNEVALDTPVAVTAGDIVRPAVWSSAGRYVRTSAFWGADLVHGDLTGIQHNTHGGVKNGTFSVDSPANTYPDNENGQASYFADLVFVPTA